MFLQGVTAYELCQYFFDKDCKLEYDGMQSKDLPFVNDWFDWVSNLWPQVL
jgi:hypothetical protein